MTGAAKAALMDMAIKVNRMLDGIPNTPESDINEVRVTDILVIEPDSQVTALAFLQALVMQVGMPRVLSALRDIQNGRT